MNSTTTTKITGLYLARATIKTSSSELKRVIDDYLDGDAVLRCDTVIKKDKNGKSYKTFFVHIKSWPLTYTSRQMEEQILGGESVQIQYNNTGSYWKFTQNKMSEPSDLRTNGIFIPRTDEDTTEEVIRTAFSNVLGNDTISRVDFVSKKDRHDKPYCSAYVHFASWPDTEVSAEIQGKLVRGDNVSVYYLDRSYWKCVLNHNINGSGRIIDNRDKKGRPSIGDYNGKSVAPYIVIDNVSTPILTTTPILSPPKLIRQRCVDINTCDNLNGYRVNLDELFDSVATDANTTEFDDTAMPVWMNTNNEPVSPIPKVEDDNLSDDEVGFGTITFDDSFVSQPRWGDECV